MGLEDDQERHKRECYARWREDYINRAIKKASRFGYKKKLAFVEALEQKVSKGIADDVRANIFRSGKAPKSRGRTNHQAPDLFAAEGEGTTRDDPW